MPVVAGVAAGAAVLASAVAAVLAYQELRFVLLNVKSLFALLKGECNILDAVEQEAGQASAHQQATRSFSPPGRVKRQGVLGVSG